MPSELTGYIYIYIYNIIYIYIYINLWGGSRGSWFKRSRGLLNVPYADLDEEVHELLQRPINSLDRSQKRQGRHRSRFMEPVAKCWAPLEARKAPWSHRPANLQQSTLPAAAEQQVLRAKREELARTTFVAERNAARLDCNEQAKVIEPVPRLHTPAGTAMMSLEEMREHLRSQIKDKPRIVTIQDKTPGALYMVCPNSYDAEYRTVEVFRASDLTEGKETVKWNKCNESRQ